MEDDKVAEFWSFPTNIADFETDHRISYSKLDNKYIAVQDDGSEFEFDSALKRWIPTIDEDLIEQHQKAYGAAEPDEPTAGLAHDNGRNLKRKQSEPSEQEDTDSGSKQNKKRQARERAQPKPKQNTAIYITGLPLDATVDEVAELFSRKCGVIAEEIDSGRPRIKLYRDDEGRFKGDALVVFFKPQSVDMAIMLLDDTPFRYTDSGTNSGSMRVQAAEASYKKTNSNGQAEGGGTEGKKQSGKDDSKRENGGLNEGKGPGGRRNDDQKQKVIKKTQKLDAKLADWDDDDLSTLASGSGRGSRWDKVVILKHMFTLKELEEDPAALLDIKEDVREECAKLGEVTNVILFDLEPDGIISVRFKTAEAAEACVHAMDGRAFDGRIVEASIATGRGKFKKSKKGDNDDYEDAGGEQ